MKNALLIHNQKNLSIIQKFMQSGCELLTTDPNMSIFTLNPSYSFSWEKLFSYENENSELFYSYERIYTPSISDFIDLRFVSSHVCHLSQINESVTDTFLYTKTKSEIYSALSKRYHGELYRMYAKLCYLLNDWEEAEFAAKELFREHGNAETSLKILILTSSRLNNFEKALQYLNGLATIPFYKEMLQKLLNEKNEKKVSSELFKIGGDFIYQRSVLHG